MSNNDISDASNKTTKSSRSFFSIPPALKRIFDRFPLTIYKANDFPVCTSRPHDKHILYVFTTQNAVERGAPSFNPSCLKWQTYLKIRGIDFDTAVSNNHASPSGSLPFMLPPSGDKDQSPITIKSMRKWINKQNITAAMPEPVDIRYEAYSALLDSRIRMAWLYQLYMMPSNTSVMHSLYVAPCTSNTIVQLSIRQQLRQAADAELRKMTRRTVLDTELLQEAEEAFGALSTLLGEKRWFFEDSISLFDASVFAYTHLLLDAEMKWQDNPLGDILGNYENLVDHRNRIYEEYY